MKPKALLFRSALLWAALFGLAPSLTLAGTPNDGSVLPFPPPPSASVAGPTLQESRHQRRVEPDRLPADAPNILIVLLDDVGFGLADTYGGPIHTPTLSRIADQGISYNAFHTYRNWQFDAATTRMPEFTAPGLARESNHVTIDAEIGEDASGVLYALGGASGGLALYMDKGRLVYEYHMMIIERYGVGTAEKIAPGRHRIEVDTTIAKPGAPAQVVLSVDGAEVARTQVERTVPAAFTASESFDVGTDLGSPVSLDYSDRRPFAFDGTIDSVRVSLK